MSLQIRRFAQTPHQPKRATGATIPIASPTHSKMGGDWVQSPKLTKAQGSDQDRDRETMRQASVVLGVSICGMVAAIAAGAVPSGGVTIGSILAGTMGGIFLLAGVTAIIVMRNQK